MLCRALKLLIRAKWRQQFYSIYDSEYESIVPLYINELLSEEGHPTIQAKLRDAFDGFQSFPDLRNFYSSFCDRISWRFFQLTSLNIHPRQIYNSDENQKQRARCLNCSCPQFIFCIANPSWKSQSKECHNCHHRATDHELSSNSNLAIVKYIPLTFNEEAICFHYQGDQCKDRLKAGDFYRNAGVFYRWKLKTEPGCSSILCFSFPLCYHLTGCYTETLYNWAKCLKHQSETEKLKNNTKMEIFYLHLALRRYESAIVVSGDDLDNATSIHVNTANSQLQLGKAYLLRGENNLANRFFKLGKSNYSEALKLKKTDDLTLFSHFFNFLQEIVKQNSLETADIKDFISQMKTLISLKKEIYIPNWTVAFDSTTSQMVYINTQTHKQQSQDPKEQPAFLPNHPQRGRDCSAIDFATGGIPFYSSIPDFTVSQSFSHPHLKPIFQDRSVYNMIAPQKISAPRIHKDLPLKQQMPIRPSNQRNDANRPSLNQSSNPEFSFSTFFRKFFW